MQIEMYYYTTAEQEKELDAQYLSSIKEKELDLKQELLRTRKIQKFTAYALVKMPLRIFHVQDGNVYLHHIAEENRCPTAAVRDGGIYKLDGYFQGLVEGFIKDHNNYKVVFSPSGRYGPTTDYCGKEHEMPAYLEADGIRLNIEDDEKYCIGVA